MTFIDSLLALDTRLFLFLNGFHNSFFDVVMEYISKMWIWIPLYISVIVYLIRKWKKESIWLILAVIACVVLTDQFTNLIKMIFERPRPSHAVDLQGLVHNVNGYLSGKYGFVSGHSANVFGFALLTSLIIRKQAYTIPIFLWAGLVAYSRIYLGVHYPLDILGGAILGFLVAGLVFWVLNTIRKRLLSDIKSRLE